MYSLASKICAGGLITSMQSSINALDASTTALTAQLALLQQQLLVVMESVQPIVDNIATMSALGNCGFVRKRIDGVMRSICNPGLEGMIKIDASFFIIGALLSALVVIGQLGAERFRKFRPDLWAANDEDSDSDDDDEDDRRAIAKGRNRGRVGGNVQRGRAPFVPPPPPPGARGKRVELTRRPVRAQKSRMV